MITVLKKGKSMIRINAIYKVKCHECNCVFTFEGEDTIIHRGETCIKCPTPGCGTYIEWEQDLRIN